MKRFTFPEIGAIGLGYALGGTDGTAIGPKTARGLVNTAKLIVDAGIGDPKLFEIVGVLEPGIRPDLISDVAAHVIFPQICALTARLCKRLKVPTEQRRVRGKEYGLPIYRASGEYLRLLPRDVLRDLPTASCWEDIDGVCSHNDELRQRQNARIGDTWRRAVNDVKKEQLKKILIANPEALKDMISQYREKPAYPYDLGRDVLGESIWYDAGVAAARVNPLMIARPAATAAGVLTVVKAIIAQFRDLIENVDLALVFWADDSTPRHERFAQRLFLVIADSYCKANNLDLSPEVNSGRGPVDFKISSGYDGRVLVEVKLSTNTRLLHGFKTQLAEYQKAERTEHGIMLLIQVSNADVRIQNLLKARSEAIRAKQIVPLIEIVDARPKASASHLHVDDGVLNVARNSERDSFDGMAGAPQRR